MSDLPYELVIECDGSSLKGQGAGAGFVASDGYSEAIPLPKDSTNNEAEYHAVIGALKYLARHPADITFAKILSDSELVVKQINGDYKVKNSRLQKLHKVAHTQIQKIGLTLGHHIVFSHIPREENTRADGISRVAALLSMAEIP